MYGIMVYDNIKNVSTQLGNKMAKKKGKGVLCSFICLPHINSKMTQNDNNNIHTTIKSIEQFN